MDHRRKMDIVHFSTENKRKIEKIGDRRMNFVFNKDLNPYRRKTHRRKNAFVLKI